MLEPSLSQLVKAHDTDSVKKYLQESSTRHITLEEFKQSFKNALTHNSQALDAFFICPNLTLHETITQHPLPNKTTQVHKKHEYSSDQVALLLWKLCEETKKESCAPAQIKNKALTYIALSDICFPHIHRLFQHGARLTTQLSLKRACEKRDDTAIKLKLAEKFVYAHAQEAFDEKYITLPDDLSHLLKIHKGMTVNGKVPEFFVKNYPYSLFWQLLNESKSLDLALINTCYYDQFLELFDQQIKGELSSGDFNILYFDLLKKFKIALKNHYLQIQHNYSLYEYLSKAVKSNHRSDVGIILSALKHHGPLNLKDSILDNQTRKTIFDQALETVAPNAHIIFDLLTAFYKSLNKASKAPNAQYFMLRLRKNFDLMSDISVLESQRVGKKLRLKNQRVFLTKLSHMLQKKQFTDCIITTQEQV